VTLEELTFLSDLFVAKAVSVTVSDTTTTSHRTTTDSEEDHNDVLEYKYLQMSSRNIPFATDNIIERCCYEHLDPHIDQVKTGGGRCRVVVTGTPGIGKTVYGALLARRYVGSGESVLYWEGDNIFLFSTNLRVQERFGLVPLVQQEEGLEVVVGVGVVHYGYWMHNEVASKTAQCDYYSRSKGWIFGPGA
jgi:hypothetical protein